MATQIQSVTRHPLNKDQVELLKQVFGEDIEIFTVNKFFNSVEELEDTVKNNISALVAPIDLVLKMMYRGKVTNATIITWKADEHSRKKGMFACRGMTVYVVTSENSILRGVVRSIDEYECVPTVMNKFADNSELPYSVE